MEVVHSSTRPYSQESLASSFDGMNLTEDALIQYDELEASFFQVLKGNSLCWVIMSSPCLTRSGREEPFLVRPARRDGSQRRLGSTPFRHKEALPRAHPLKHDHRFRLQKLSSCSSMFSPRSFGATCRGGRQSREVHHIFCPNLAGE